MTHLTSYEYLSKLEENLHLAVTTLRREGYHELTPGLVMLLADAKEFQRLYHLAMRKPRETNALEEYTRAETEDDFFDERWGHADATDTESDTS